MRIKGSFANYVTLWGGGEGGQGICDSPNSKYMILWKICDKGGGGVEKVSGGLIWILVAPVFEILPRSPPTPSNCLMLTLTYLLYHLHHKILEKWRNFSKSGVFWSPCLEYAPASSYVEILLQQNAFDLT
jgi:hypothetical protein